MNEILDSSVVVKLTKLTKSDIKKHTNNIARNFDMPFHIGFVGQMNNLCHIHESYSFDHYQEILDKCK